MLVGYAGWQAKLVGWLCWLVFYAGWLPANADRLDMLVMLAGNKVYAGSLSWLCCLTILFMFVGYADRQCSLSTLYTLAGNAGSLLWIVYIFWVEI
jgi:hypothetical protein